MSKLVLQGTVVSVKTEKTAKIEVVRPRLNSLGRVERRKRFYLVHDPENTCKEHIGSQVKIRQCRPMSRRKHFELQCIV